MPIVIEHVRLDRRAARTDDDAVAETIIMRAACVVVLVAAIELNDVVMNTHALNALDLDRCTRPRG